MAEFTVDREQAINRLMRFLAVEGITGQEQAIGAEVARALSEIGVPAGAIRFDDANTRIPLPTQTGNLIVTLPGTKPGPRRLFSTHLDTVPLCAGAVPVRKGRRIVPAGKTALGGDNRTGVAALVTMLAELLTRNIPHAPLTVLFTVREESGLWGARTVDAAELGDPAMGFNIDGGSAQTITIGAVGADRWEVEIFGKAAHAGVHPERGISATIVLARALASIHKDGWFGKVKKAGMEGTSNVGPVGDADGGCAGQATNVVTDYVKVNGESRSHDAKCITAITAAYRQAFQTAARQVRDDKGKTARVRFTTQRSYFPYRLREDSAVVRAAQNVAASLGWQTTLKFSNGGLDANWLTRHGIPALTFGAGQHDVHTIAEYADLDEFIDGCIFALALAAKT
ncbi:MAG: M20/M25/M40 family metallo-hydrolase [Planctomycetes bacterium]|nr:M20/M25/M40 family metallo-hydrolase [Planctomycetota bacterium]